MGTHEIVKIRTIHYWVESLWFEIYEVRDYADLNGISVYVMNSVSGRYDKPRLITPDDLVSGSPHFLGSSFQEAKINILEAWLNSAETRPEVTLMSAGALDNLVKQVKLVLEDLRHEQN